MTIRQYLAAAGAVLAPNMEVADYIVEVRAGAVGTDRDDLLIGIPATTLPAFPGAPYSMTTIPEIAFMKRTKQRGVAKIALFAYNRRTGRPVWASGNSQGESGAQNLWFAGAGPLTRGTIYSEAMFVGNPIPVQAHSDYDPTIEQSQVFPDIILAPTVPIPVSPPAPPRNIPFP